MDTVSELEALLILRAHPDQDWNIHRIAARVYASELEMGQVLERFATEGFLTRAVENYRYSVKDAQTDQTISELARCYATHLIPVTNMIHSKPRSMRKFSDAFKLRKDS